MTTPTLGIIAMDDGLFEPVVIFLLIMIFVVLVVGSNKRGRDKNGR